MSIRILVVMAAQWPRALLRAELREAGYDALGARDLDEALSYPTEEVGRGPVRLIVLDQAAIPSSDDPRVDELLKKHAQSGAVLIAGALQPSVPGRWLRVLRHPTAIAEILQTVRQLLPPIQEVPPTNRQ
jgi:hypothetical protein